MRTVNIRVLFDSKRIDETELREPISTCGFDPLDGRGNT